MTIEQALVKFKSDILKWVTKNLKNKSDSDHTHNYAASSTEGGSADSAAKLDSSAGTETQPIYFKDGKPTETKYTLEKSVPSDAVFTDTHYNTGLKVGTSNESIADAAANNGGVFLNILDNNNVKDSHRITGTGSVKVTSDENGDITIDGLGDEYKLDSSVEENSSVSENGNKYVNNKTTVKLVDSEGNQSSITVNDTYYKYEEANSTTAGLISPTEKTKLGKLPGVFLTQEEYNKLPDTKETDGIIYYITDANSSGSGGSSSGLSTPGIFLTQAQYDALPDSKYEDGIVYYITDGSSDYALNIDYDNDSSGLEATNVQVAVDVLNTLLEETKKSVADGKTSVASALTNQGVSTDSDATFNTISTNINTLATNKYNAGKAEGRTEGINESKVGTAVDSDVLTGKTFTNSNDIGITGTMTNNGAWTGSTTGSGNVTIPEGYHNGNGYVSGQGAYNAGVTAADNRANTNSTNYKTGYNAGYSAGVTAGGAGKYVCKSGTSTHTNSDGTTGWKYITINTGLSFITGFAANIVRSDDASVGAAYEPGYTTSNGSVTIHAYISTVTYNINWVAYGS